MSRTHQMAFELAGKINRTFNSTFQGASGQVQQLGARARELEKSFEQAGDGTGSLTRDQRELQRQLYSTQQRMIGMQRVADARLGRSLRNVGSEFRRLGTRAAGLVTAAGASIFALANSTAKLGDDVAKTSAVIGISQERLQELRYSAERAGIETSNLDSSMQRMVRRVSEAAQGSGEAADALAELGLSAHELNNMEPDQQMYLLADAFQDVENQADRARLAHDVFGRSGMDMVNMLGEGSAGLKAMGEEAHRAGYVMDREAAEAAEKYSDAMSNLRSNISSLRITLGKELMPVVTKVMKRFSGKIEDNRERVEKFAQALAQRVKQAIPVLQNLAERAWHLSSSIAGLVKRAADLVGGFDRLAIIVGAVFSAKLLIAVGGLIKSFVILGTAIPPLVKGFWAMSAAMYANPFGLILAGVAGLAAGAYYLITRWDKVTGFFSEVWQRLREIFTSIDFTEIGRNLINALVSGIKARATAPIDAVKNVAGNVRDMLPFSDAKEGPFSDLTKAGMAIPKTLGEGLKRATPQLQANAKKALAAGVTGLTLAGSPAMEAQASVQPVMQDIPRIQDQFARAQIGAETGRAGSLDQTLEGPGQGFSAVVHFSPTVNISGEGKNVERQVHDGLSSGFQDLERQIDQVWQKKHRLSYA